MNYNFTEEDIKFVEKAIELKNKGFYIDGNQLTEVYNRILNKRVNSTSCGSCLRQRISELEGALNHYKANKAISRASDSVSDGEQTTTKEEENKALTEAEIMKERMAKVRAARKKKD